MTKFGSVELSVHHKTVLAKMRLQREWKAPDLAAACSMNSGTLSLVLNSLIRRKLVEVETLKRPFHKRIVRLVQTAAVESGAGGAEGGLVGPTSPPSAEEV